MREQTPHHARLCARLSDLPPDWVTPVVRYCTQCHEAVSYDPLTSIPGLGVEIIVCTVCVDAAIERWGLDAR